MLTLGAIIWQGFAFTWHDKVHRVGGFGSWVEGDQVHQMARAGTATDTATWTTRYAVLHDVTSHSGRVTTTVEAVEQERAAFVQTLVLEGRSAVLNGFSIETLGQPKKLSELEVSVSGTPHEAGLLVTIEGALRMSCESGECGRDDAVTYEVTVHVLGLDTDTRPLEPLTNTFDYDSREPADLKRGELTTTQGLTAFRGFRFQASKVVEWLRPDDTPHLFAWNTWLQNGQANAFFAHNPAHWSNFGHTGQASITMEPVAVQGAATYCAWTSTAAFGNKHGGEDQYATAADCL